jgi:magnesium transporter
VRGRPGRLPLLAVAKLLLVVDFYQSRTDAKMNHAMERLAVLAVVTLPVTAVASVYGMNVIVNTRTDLPHLTVVLVLMAAMSVALLRWARQQGWC